MVTPPRLATQASSPRFGWLVRSLSLLVAGVVSVLILSSVVPPIVADQSDRAIINVPIALLTAPVSGDVEEIGVRPGQSVIGGQTVARLSNSRVDRSTLIALETKAAETRGRAAAAASKRQSNLTYLDNLDYSIREQSEQNAAIIQQQVTELRSRVAASVSSGQERKSVVERQAAMVARNVASPDMMKPAEQQLAGALHTRDAEAAKLGQKITQLEALRKGVYVGEELISLASLTQKRRDIEFDAQRLAIEQTELEASLGDQQNLLAAERNRLVSLAAATIDAPNAGEILSVGAAEGRHVSAGDAIATLVACERAIVVAIFSYRQAQNLSVGTRVEIAGLDPDFPASGVVREILPKASDKVDELYAVPFPQTERREMYVFVTPDFAAKEERVRALPRSAGPACNVGQWVTITRTSGWVPSISVVWRNVQLRMSELVRTTFEPTSAKADSHPRAGLGRAF